MSGRCLAAIVDNSILYSLGEGNSISFKYIHFIAFLIFGILECILCWKELKGIDCQNYKWCYVVSDQ